MRKPKLRPLADRIVVRREESETKTPGGLIIPDNAKEKPARGEVLAVGPGKERDDGSRCAMTVEVGDVVWFGKYSGSEVKIDGETYCVIREEDVLGVVVDG